MTIWVERRLARARKCAEEGKAGAWRTLANLAAAYGRSELAREAHDRCGVSSATTSLSTPVEVLERLEITVRSPTPLARTAWLRRLGFGGVKTIGSDGALILSGIESRIAEYLRRHPELEVR